MENLNKSKGILNEIELDEFKEDDPKSKIDDLIFPLNEGQEKTLAPDNKRVTFSSSRRKLVDDNNKDKNLEKWSKKNAFQSIHTKNMSAETTNEQSILSFGPIKDKSMLSFSNIVSEHKEEDEASSMISGNKHK